MNDFNVRNLLKPRQICFVFLALMPVTKLVTFPSYLAENAGGQLGFCLLINFLADILLLLLILHIGKSFGDKTFYNVSEAALGKPVTKIAYSIYAVYFFLKALLPLLEQKNYIENTLYEIMPAGITFFPFFFVSVYSCVKGLKILGRCCDVTIIATVIGLLFAIFLSVGSADFSFFMPIFKKPAYNLVKTSFHSLTWFADSLYMLFFLGHFRREKHSERNVVLSYAGAAAAASAFIAVFFAVYGPISGSQPFAVPAATVFSVNATNAARFDYLAVFLLLFAQINAIILPLFLCTKCVERVLGTTKGLWVAIAVNILAAAAIIAFSHKIFALLEFAGDYLSYFFAFTAFILTPAILIAARCRYENV